MQEPYPRIPHRHQPRADKLCWVLGMMGSARLPQGWPGFDSCLEFVLGFCFTPRVFFSGFSSLHKINSSTRKENPRWCGFLPKYYLFILCTIVSSYSHITVFTFTLRTTSNTLAGNLMWRSAVNIILLGSCIMWRKHLLESGMSEEHRFLLIGLVRFTQS